MSDLIVIQPQVTELTVTEDVNQVVVSSVGVQGPAGAAGATGATGATGAAGSSGVVTVNAPLINAGTSSAANLSVSAGSTSTAGVLQLTDSIASTSTTTAATPNSVLNVLKSIPALPKISGYYYRSPSNSYQGVSVIHQTMLLTPIFIDRNMTIDRVGFQTGQSYVGTSTVRLGIYSDSNGLPSTLLVDAGTVTATTNNTTYQITVSQAVTTGWYWGAFCQQGTAPTTGQYFGNQQGIVSLSAFQGGSSSINANMIAGYGISSVTGAFPSTASSLTAQVTIPSTWFRVS